LNWGNILKVLQKLKKKKISKHNGLVLIVVGILVALILFFSYMYLYGGVVNERSSITLSISSPSEGQVFNQGQEIGFNGYVLGGVIDKVIIWDEKYNVGIECGSSASYWSQSVPVSQLSVGKHVICARALCTDGTWSPIVCRTVDIQSSSSSYIVTDRTISSTMGVMGFIFQPIEAVANAVVVTIEGGTSPDDLNGDNIPDQFQQSPAGPSHNPMNMPMTTLIITILIFTAIVIGLMMLRRILTLYMARREQRIERLQSKPEWRTWQLQRLKIQEKETGAKLRSARERIAKQEEQIKHLQKEKAVTINIERRQLTNNKKTKNKGKVKEEKISNKIKGVIKNAGRKRK